MHRRDQLRAGEFLKKQASENEKITFVYDTVLEEIKGSGKVQEVLAKNVKTGQEEMWKTDGVFVFVGHFPNTDIFKGQLKMDEQNFLITDKNMQTSVEGVFAAGEVQDPIYKQAVSSAGQGCQAAIAAERWLSARE